MMGAKGGIALKFLQWFVRGIQFCCAGLILAIFSYFLATLHNHDLPIATWIRAVEGISGFATLYTVIALLLLCCLAGRTVTSFLAIVFDVAFVVAFIYVAAANRAGASSCTGQVSTPFGDGDANSDVRDNGSNGGTSLPNLRQACQLQSACFAVAILAIFLFVFSALLEIALARHHRKEKRFGPGPQNDYTSGYGKRRFFSFRRRRDTVNTENQLPAHTHPNEVRNSYNTDTTAIGHQDPIYSKYGDTPYGHHAGTQPGHLGGSTYEMNEAAHTTPHRYGDGTYTRV